MINKIIKIVRKIVVAFLILYAFNVLVNSLGIYIPINIFSLSIVACLGFPGLSSLVVLFYLLK